jgi:hypothetical protein
VGLALGTLDGTTLVFQSIVNLARDLSGICGWNGGWNGGWNSPGGR